MQFGKIKQTMAGGKVGGFGFQPPTIKYRGLAMGIGAVYWFFLGYRIYHDGGHHLVSCFCQSTILKGADWRLEDREKNL